MNAEQVPFRVQAVSLITHTRYGHLRHCHRAAVAGDLVDELFDRRNFHGIDGLGHCVLLAQDAAIDARLIVRSGLYQPIFRSAVPLCGLPSEHYLVKLGRSLRILGCKFKMNDSIHDKSPSLFLRRSFMATAMNLSSPP